MDELHNIVVSEPSAISDKHVENTQQSNRKAGRPPKMVVRSHKESCRLTHEEKEERRAYCKRYGIKPADLLRASYLASTIIGSPEKIILDSTVVVRELAGSTEQMKTRLSRGGHPITFAEMTAINRGLNAVWKILRAAPFAVVVLLAWSAGRVDAFREINLNELFEDQIYSIKFMVVCVTLFGFGWGIIVGHLWLPSPERLKEIERDYKDRFAEFFNRFKL